MILTIELCQLRELRASYFYMPTNLFDIAFATLLLQLLTTSDDSSGTTRALSRILFWVRGILLLRAFENMSALLFMVEAIIQDTRESMLLLLLFISATAHAFVSGGYLHPDHVRVFFRTLGIGVHGDGIPEEFLPEESLPEITSLGDLVMKIAIFSVCLYLVNIVMMNFLIAVMGDTFERVTEQREILALRNKALLLLEVNAFFPTWLSGRTKPRFLSVCVESNEAKRWRDWPANSAENWSGFTGDLKREMRTILTEQKSMQAEQKSLQDKIDEIQKSLHALAEKTK
jgi:hypothetical protein